MTTEQVGYLCFLSAGVLVLWQLWKPEWTQWLKSKLPSRKQLFGILPIALLLVGGVILVRGQGCQIDLPIINFKPQVYPDAWLVIVEESSERKPELAVLLQDWSWRQSLDERDINFRIYDRDQEEAKSYEKLKLDLPAVVFVTPQGKVVYVGKCPSDKKAMEELIRKVTGK